MPFNLTLRKSKHNDPAFGELNTCIQHLYDMNLPHGWKSWHTLFYSQHSKAAVFESINQPICATFWTIPRLTHRYSSDWTQPWTITITCYFFLETNTLARLAWLVYASSIRLLRKNISKIATPPSLMLLPRIPQRNRASSQSSASSEERFNRPNGTHRCRRRRGTPWPSASPRGQETLQTGGVSRGFARRNLPDLKSAEW
jgi:hypothetical protein